MKYLAFFCFAVATVAAEPNVIDQFYRAIRAGDASAVQKLIRNGADANTRDSRGGTPLFYAAEVGTPEIMRLLITAGADVNARTAFGATPLMWSTADISKVRLLVQKGADVNATSKAGNTALQIAAAQAGNLELVRFLVEHGASLKTSRNESGNTPLIRAAYANDLAMVKFLVEKGEDVNAANIGGRTPLMSACMIANPDIVKLLLARGANVNARMKPHQNPGVKHGPVDVGGLTALMLAATSQSPTLVRILLNAGADVNAKDVRGMTPLMLAVASDHADPEIVRLLLARRPDLAVTSNGGETALAWARKFHYQPVLSQIENASAGLDIPSPAPVIFDQASAPDIRQAAERSVSLVQRTTAGFFHEGGCVSCHAQHMAGLVAAVARSKGLPIDEKAAADVLQETRLQFASRADLFLEREDGPADLILTTALAALAFQNAPADRMTDAMLRNIASQQSPAGKWSLIGIVRPPTADGSITNTALSIRAIRQYAPPALKAEMDARIARAANWILHAEPSTTEDAVMQLLGAKWGGEDRASIERLTKKLLALQRQDGGWAQLRQLEPDAYATGAALYALYEGGGISPSEDAYRRGVRFLLETQAKDGSWHVSSRAPRIQPYFESGFPYGKDQWISQWATGWSAVALTLALPETIAAR